MSDINKYIPYTDEWKKEMMKWSKADLIDFLRQQLLKIKELENPQPMSDNKIVIGCNYHTTWQSNKAMRFVLTEIKGDKARLTTRNTGKSFWTNISDLIFIDTDHNKEKAKKLLQKQIS